MRLGLSRRTVLYASLASEKEVIVEVIIIFEFRDKLEYLIQTLSKHQGLFESPKVENLKRKFSAILLNEFPVVFESSIHVLDNVATVNDDFSLGE